MITPEYLDELERLCEAANDILDFDYEAQGCAWMPLLKSHRDMLQCGIDQIPELVAEVRRLSEWQPIETAPKNKWLLLGYYNQLGKWRTVRGNWIHEGDLHDIWEEPIEGEGWYETADNADDIPNVWPINPTHWMPLPAAPAQPTTGDGE